jgi:hypothetical protein
MTLELDAEHIEQFTLAPECTLYTRVAVGTLGCPR